MDFRFIDTGFNTGSMNMAVDEAIAIQHGKDLVKPTIRFYRWMPASLSLGYFQDIADINLDECKKHGIGIVRRLTGGKTVLHDKELTYSVVASEKLMPSSIIESYKAISNGILLGLKKLGINASMRAEKVEKTNNPICFHDPNYYEILCRGKKMVGSAQARKHDAVLQHGSIPYEIDIERMCGLFNVDDISKTIEKTKQSVTWINNELNGSRIGYDELKNALKKGFEENFGCRLIESSLSKDELNTAKELDREKYSADEWNFRKH